ncbi:glutathione S-transferase family protein [Amphritea sp. 1_MG-2023]|uniref:glutathione S-transferase family protein n=1 Tax=Amphritea sp. 1_MG-2023 TaxID=3062670 RepID=UPI0026E2DBFA|nr:glutathione S-transferase family protein [Amphritea sp. 1_MG-2023]MDO6562995.1 glutathione S-transferase family protein [Amphritea sp. 1_MG-2023]
MQLIIGNYNYSSWSLRAWLMLRHFDLAFDTTRIALFTPGSAEQIKAYNPAGKVPVLLDNGTTVWDSLSICEYISETYLQDQGWPSNPARRAHARSSCAEMHSGFMALRSAMPMNCRRHVDNFTISVAVQQDIDRISTLWREALSKSGSEQFLYGDFSIADACYAPVVFRLTGYGVKLPAELQAYCDRMLALPACQEWLSLAQQESEVIEEEDV